MTLPVLICDDSSLARKQLARILPKDWDIELHFAENGQEALERIREGKGALMFLDLNMPVMDGYETLEEIRKNDLNTLVLVVSGDVQPEAKARVLKLGALDFIRKPTDVDTVTLILSQYGFFSPEDFADSSSGRDVEIEVNQRDMYQEVANVAMGRAGELLAKAIDVFVELPIPTVNQIAASELHMVLSALDSADSVSAVTQGFTGDGIHGEAMVIFNDASFKDMGRLLESDLKDQKYELEALLDVSNLLNGACLQGLGEQLHVRFNQAHPVVLGRQVSVKELLEAAHNQWEQVLAIEIGYRLEGFNIEFDLLLLFPGSSLPLLEQKLQHLLEAS
ncbi:MULTISPECIES: response regulator [Gammaproteobacteria]|uniref:response regulator n=1 Tax=Gammaproteobacteria TaxID=1236 RepID=UPI000DCF9054|nr:MULTISPECIES: response regulator [Gammaproteobacteria]RTE86228.1 response regulator [Aliidiomarina sp. B3213]TCZ91579.1 response regulator [Lysobacter sp. N42]